MQMPLRRAPARPSLALRLFSALPSAVQRHASVFWRGYALLLCVLLLSAAEVGAHATPLQYDPPVTAILEQPPTSVRIRFTERVDLAGSHIHVVGPSNLRVDDDTPTHAPDNPLVLQVNILAWQPGTYTVQWQAFSRDDAHLTKGTYSFAFGQGATAGVSAAAVTYHVSVWHVGSLALELLALALLVGGKALMMCFQSPGAAQKRLKHLLVVGSVLLLMATGAELLLQLRGAALRITELLSLVSPVWRLLASVVVLLGASQRTRPMARIFIAGVLFALLLRARASHAAAGTFFPTFFVGVQAIHLLGKSLWVGVLLAGAVVLRVLHRTEADHTTVLRLRLTMSQLLSGALGIGGLTGLLVVWLHLKDVSNIVRTMWGSYLVTLLLLAGAAFVLRCYTQWSVDPALMRMLAGREAHLGKRCDSVSRALLVAEVLIAVAMLVVSSVLALTTPPFVPTTPSFADSYPASFTVGIVVGIVVLVLCALVLLRQSTAQLRDLPAPGGRFQNPRRSDVSIGASLAGAIILSAVTFPTLLYGPFAAECRTRGHQWREALPVAAGRQLAFAPLLGCSVGSGHSLFHVTSRSAYATLLAPADMRIKLARFPEHAVVRAPTLLLFMLVDQRDTPTTSFTPLPDGHYLHVDIRDPAGRMLGTFKPEASRYEAYYLERLTGCPIGHRRSIVRPIYAKGALVRWECRAGSHHECTANSSGQWTDCTYPPTTSVPWPQPLPAELILEPSLASQLRTRKPRAEGADSVGSFMLYVGFPHAGSYKLTVHATQRAHRLSETFTVTIGK